MNKKLSLLACGLSVFVGHAWAVESPPTNGVLSYTGVIADGRHDSMTESAPGALSSVSVSGNYASGTASARTTLGGNHANLSGGGTNFGTGVSISQWYDQGVITGGTGTGTAQFTMQLHGLVQAGSSLGIAALDLDKSITNPTLAQPIVAPGGGSVWGLPSDYERIAIDGISTDAFLYGNDPLGTHVVDITLHGTLSFTYDESFYLMGRLFLQVSNVGDLYDANGNLVTQATVMDFSNSAYITGLELPAGATASFTSGTDYNNIPIPSSVPEPGAWGLMLSGLVLVGAMARRAQRRRPGLALA